MALIEITTKDCTDCKRHKPLSEFYQQKKTSKKSGEYVYYVPQCKECTKSRAIKWKGENRESFLESQKKRNKKFAMQMRENTKRRRENGEYRKWQQNNKDKIKEYQLQRTMNKTHDISNEEWINCKEHFNFACAYCGISEEEAKKEYGNFLHKEHVEHNGSNEIDNCIPACKRCNGLKWTFSMDEWYNELNDYYTPQRYEKIIGWLIKFTL